MIKIFEGNVTALIAFFCFNSNLRNQKFYFFSDATRLKY